MRAREIGLHPDVDMLFSDEDKIDERGRRFDPYFKTDWNPALMLSQNAFCHLGVYRRSLVDAVGGLREGYDVSLLTNGFRKLIKELNLDVLMIDTHPGLNEETLFSLAISHVLVIIMRPDQQDYEGTGVTIEVARSLDVPRLLLMVNKTPAAFSTAEVRTRVEQTYGCEVAAVLPHSDEMMTLASSGIFVVRYPDHPLTALYKEVAAKLMA